MLRSQRNLRTNLAMRFLIVDDEPINQKILIGLLQKKGECDTALDGNQAVEKFKHSLTTKQFYDAIFLDIMMPNCSGQDALNQIRSAELANNISVDDSVKVFMVTALDDAENQFEALTNGVVAYLVKPLDRRKLDEELSKAGLI